MPRITDETHGVVVVTFADTRLLVAVGAMAAEIRRTPGDVRPDVPIGTRDPDRLTLLVDGVRARLAPGTGRFSRKSYRVEAWAGDAHYVLRPADDGSALWLDGRERGFFPDDDHPAVWIPGVGTTRDAVVGYALTAAFGVRARSLYDAVITAAVTPVVGGQR